MAPLPSFLSSDQRGTIEFSTGLSFSGTLNSISGWTWSGSTPALYAGTESGHKWGGGLAGTPGGAVSYYFDPGSGFSPSVASMFVSALTLWSDLANISFVQTTDPAQAQLSLYLFNTATPNVPLDNGAYATAVYQPGKPGDAVIPATQAVSVSIEQTGGWAQLDSLTYNGGYGPSTIVHELGHAVGLMHTGPYNGNVNAAVQQYNTTDTYLWSIMSYIEADETSAKYYSYYSVTGTSYTPQLSSTTPQMLDIIGLQQLYGLPASTTFAGGQVFGFNTNITDAAGIFYDFTRNVDPVVTLWDSGVGNTLDLSGFFTPSVVNLNPGTFSSVDGMTNNIAIAYGTAIDHAIGGAGADTFILNASSDVIDGGGGSNTATFRDASAAYVISATIGGYNVSNGAVTHRLSNIQTLAFPDAAIAVAALPAGDTFQWRTGNGAFGDAANWTNLTTGGPAATPPDADDVALLPGPVSGGPQIVSGDGKAAQLVFTGLAGVTGALTTTRLTIGQGGGQSAMLTIAPDATITSDSAAVGNGTLRVNGRLTAAGTVTMSPIDAASSAVIEMRLGGVAQVGALVLNGGTVTVDASSAFEVGTAGGAAAGKITIDADGTISGNGALSSVVDEGTVIAAGGTLGIGSLTGSKGVVRIAADGTLRLADSTAVPIAFSGAGGTLALKAPVSSLLTLGSVSGFAPGAAIAITALEEGKALSLLQPVYDAGTGLLSVRTAEGAGVAAKLVGDFGDDVFVLRPTGTGTFTLLAAPGTLNGSTTPSAGTQDGSVFAWATNGSGDWNTAANWKDLGTTPQSVAPGAKDNTVVQGAILPNTVQVLSGTANALNLLFLGTNAVSGQITVGETLAVGMIGDPATLSLIGSATIAAATVSVPAGTLLDVAGGTRLAITNDLTLASDPLQSLAPLQVHGGGIVQAGSLVLSGSAAPIALDRISTIEVGTGGDAAAGMLTVDAGHAVRGSGDLSTIAVADNGTVLADGGVLSLGMVSGSGSLRIGGNATLSLAGAEANPIDFAGANGTLLVRSTEATLGMVTGFNLGETIAVAALPQSLPTTVNYTPTGTQLGTLSLTNQFGTKVTMTLVGDYSGVDFVLGSGATPSVATVTVTCFVAGTRIATPDGEVAIESLRPGDLVCTRFAPEPQPVVWIGRRHLDCRQHPAPHRVWPVRVRAGCFGPGMPARDLLLSPDHSVFVDGVLIPVRYLADGVAIEQVAVDEVEYFHLELPRHDVLRAEGMPAESYLDTGDRGNFSNGGVVRAYPDFVSRTWEAEGCAPLVVTGPLVEAVRRQVRRHASPPKRRRRRAA